MPQCNQLRRNYQRFLVFHTVILPIIITFILMPTYFDSLLFIVLTISRAIISNYLTARLLQGYRIITVALLIYVFFAKRLYWLLLHSLVTWCLFVGIHISTRHWENAGLGEV